ncbi:MAG: P-type conjugative transfer protein VirB9 [Alphaproteobacteria bacterium]|nr:P-type conjugative transfer protein VirB9 [Alphaproteobacteria bacterium]
MIIPSLLISRECRREVTETRRVVARFFLLSLVFSFFAVLLASGAEAAKEPRALTMDKRIKTVVYNPNDVVIFLGHYGLQSNIEFSPEEEPVTVVMGDSTAWMVNPAGNRIFLKPIEQDATTNMTVITNLRTYFFELHAEKDVDIGDPKVTFSLRFLYPDEGTSIGLGASDINHDIPMPEIDKNPGKYNFAYSITGPEYIAPIRIFDDGEFTYFEFRNKNADIPGFFMVRSDGSEEIINFRKRGDFIVVERVASQFTLRHGSETICVYNDRMPLRGAVNRPRADFDKYNPPSTAAPAKQP